MSSETPPSLRSAAVLTLPRTQHARRPKLCSKALRQPSKPRAPRTPQAAMAAAKYAVPWALRPITVSDRCGSADWQHARYPIVRSTLEGQLTPCNAGLSYVMANAGFTRVRTLNTTQTVSNLSYETLLIHVQTLYYLTATLISRSRIKDDQSQSHSKVCVTSFAAAILLPAAFT